MGLKREELSNPFGCLGKAADDEPIFVLRGQDLLAPTLVRQWARHYAMLNSVPRNIGTEHKPEIRLEIPEHVRAKHDEAMKLAKQMDEWHIRKLPD